MKNKRPICGDVDKQLAVAGIGFSLFILIVLLLRFKSVITWSYGIYPYILICLLFLVSCIIWLSIRKKVPLEFNVPRSQLRFLVSLSLFFVLFTTSILTIYYRTDQYQRPLIYFISTSLMTGVLALEILYSEESHKYLILSQILIIALSIVWTQSLMFPTISGSDPWYHWQLTSGIIQKGFIPANYAYSKMPIFHLVIGLTSLITSLGYKWSSMLSVSLESIICNALFTFLLCMFLFSSYKLALLSSLSVTVADRLISLNYRPIPDSFSLLFILMILYLLFRRPRHGTTILLVLMFALILTHTLASVFMAISLFVNWIVFNYRRSHRNRIVSFSMLALFTVGMLGWWTYASGDIAAIGNVIKWGFSIQKQIAIPKQITGYLSTVPLWEQMLNNSPLFTYFFFSFLGFFYMTSRKDNFKFSLALLGAIPLAIGALSALSGHSMLWYRWYYFAELMLSIPFAIGLLVITWRNEAMKLLTPLFVLCLVTSLTFLTTLNPEINDDNHILSPNTAIRYAFTQSELSAASFAVERCRNVSSDWDYINAIRIMWDISHTSGTNVGFFTLDESLYSHNFVHDGHAKIVRRQIITSPFRLLGGVWRIDYNPNLVLSSPSSRFNRIYDNSMVSIYL